MGLVVHKYGGSSVGSPEKIRLVAEKVHAVRKEGKDVVVVVSAMEGDTDRLIRLAHEITPEPKEREMDMLLSSGERVTIALLTMALESLGCPAVSLTGRQVGIITDSAHTRARIKEIQADRIRDSIQEGKVAVVAGFQGIDESSNVTTLGRGGSDTTAVAIAGALNAELCVIYTDVDGVYTTDPNLVPKARRIDRISFDEMLEMASLGAKVLQTRSVEFGKKYSIPILVKSAFQDGPGTLVTTEDEAMEQVLVSGVPFDTNQAKVTITGIPDKPGVAAKIFGSISDRGVVVDMIIQNVGESGLTDISFTVPKTDAQIALKISRELAQEIDAKEAILDDQIVKVSIVGVGMRSHGGVAAKMFSTFAREEINIMMISTSEIKISCVIEAKHTEKAVGALHETFGLNQSETN